MSQSDDDINDCILAHLIPFLAADERICSIDHLPDHYQPMNDYAATITQGGSIIIDDNGNEELTRPWFDAGIDGTGEVLSVSDRSVLFYLQENNNFYFSK